VATLPSLPAIRWRVVGLLAGVLLMLAAVSASYLAYIGNLATTNYTIQRLQEERDRWRAQNEQLKVELAKMRSLTWIEHEAVGRLKMQKPAQLVYLQVAPPDAQRAGSGDLRQASSR
jgi:hypothetical protein